MEKGKYTVRDMLAFDRTELANERTFLAYVRTFVGMMASGAALLKLFDVAWAHTTAIVLLILGPAIFLLGFVRFIRVKNRLKRYTPDET